MGLTNASGAGVVSDDVASGVADAGNPTKVAGKYNATQPTFTDGNRADLQLGFRGAVRVNIQTADGLIGVSAAAPTDAQSTALGHLLVSAAQGVYNGASWDRQRTPAKFITISAVSINTEATLWTPTSGKKFRFMGGTFKVSGAAGNILFKDNTAGTTIFVLPIDNTATTPITLNLGNGILSAAANNLFTATLTGATLSGVVWGTEE